MNEPTLRGRLLTQLFRRGQNNEKIDLIGLAEACGASLYGALRALQELEAAGLVDAGRLRLTLSGLALAAAFSDPERAAAPSERRTGRPLPRARRAA